uniref:Uncharacterized protein n=1 Tax=Romanomermis culicivorax TaxID=13658 RepID=A0A915HYE2_ROMCU
MSKCTIFVRSIFVVRILDSCQQPLEIVEQKDSIVENPVLSLMLLARYSRVTFTVAIVAMVASPNYNMAANDFDSCPCPKFDGKNWTTIAEECLEILNVMVTMFDNKWLSPLGTKNIEEPPLVTRIPGRVMDMFANDAPYRQKRNANLEFGTVRPIYLGNRVAVEHVQNATPDSRIYNESDILTSTTFPMQPHKSLENSTSSTHTDVKDDHNLLFKNDTLYNNSEFVSVKIMLPETVENTTFENTDAFNVSRPIMANIFDKTPEIASSMNTKSKLDNGEYSNFTTIAVPGVTTDTTVKNTSTLTTATGTTIMTRTNLNNRTTNVPFPYSSKELNDKMRQKGMDNKTLKQICTRLMKFDIANKCCRSCMEEILLKYVKVAWIVKEVCLLMAVSAYSEEIKFLSGFQLLRANLEKMANPSERWIFLQRRILIRVI